MVKKFIQGLLGKKEDKSADSTEKSIEEVPDELPPLAEDILKKEEEKIAEKKEVTKETKEEPKEEKEDEVLSDLLKEFKEYKEKYKEKEEKIDEKEAKEEEKQKITPSVSKSLDSEKPEKEEKAIEDKEETIKQPQITQPISEKEEDKGFFSELLSITKNQGINESVLNQDLFKKMKNYWYFHPQEKGKSKNKEKLEYNLFEKLSELKRLEERWITQKKFIEEDKRILLEKEREIEIKTRELQGILNQLRFYEDVSSDKYLRLNNGMVVKNIHELIGLLEVIDDKTFRYHVNNKRNDFSEWIKNATGNKELAKKINSAKTKEELLIILENTSMSIDEINPENYFRLSNGGIIKDVKELAFALKEIDDITFNRHVNNERNDFSLWIKDVFKNNYLANKLQTAKSKGEMIKILEEFL